MITRNKNTHVYIEHTQTYKHAHTYIHACIHTYIHTHTLHLATNHLKHHMWVFFLMHTYIHEIHSHIHTCIHTYVHTYTDTTSRNISSEASYVGGFPNASRASPIKWIDAAYRRYACMYVYICMYECIIHMHVYVCVLVC
jgi:hypothetical protein